MADDTFIYVFIGHLNATFKNCLFSSFVYLFSGLLILWEFSSLG
jgi:hypothetical protein